MTAADLAADWQFHPISGYARAAEERGGDGFFECPLISHIHDNLWSGGCLQDVKLDDDFTFVLSLYPWERFDLGPDTRRTEVRLYDSNDVPETGQLEDLADTITREAKEGKVLVHCQAGLNRSGLLTGLALVRGFGFSPSEAIALLRHKRSPMVLCNKAFEAWLLTVNA